MKPVGAQVGSHREHTRLVYAEDLGIGQRFDLGSHTVTEAELVDLAAHWDPAHESSTRNYAIPDYFNGQQNGRDTLKFSQVNLSVSEDDCTMSEVHCTSHLYPLLDRAQG